MCVAQTEMKWSVYPSYHHVLIIFANESSWVPLDILGFTCCVV